MIFINEDMERDKVLPDFILKISAQKFIGFPPGYFDEKFIPSVENGLVIHFRDTFKLSTQKYRDVILPKILITGNVNHRIQLKSIGDVESLTATFKPYGLYRLFNIDMLKLSEKCFIKADDLIDKSIYSELSSLTSTNDRMNLLSSYLVDKINKSKIPKDITDDIFDYIMDNNGALRIDHLSEKFNVTERFIRRRFNERIGLCPKQVIKIARIAYIVKNINSISKVDWVGFIEKCAYTDYSHLYKDFKNIVGESPNSFFKRDRENLNFISFLLKNEMKN